MSEDEARTLGQRLRAARIYAGKSRKQVGLAVGRSAEQIGRYERGQWKTDAPGKAIIEATARFTGVPLWFLTEGFAGPAKRFAEAARLEAQRTREHPESMPGDPGDEDAADEGA